MTRPASPCPFYRILCEYVPMADRTDELEAENAKLRAENAKLRAALEPFAEMGRVMMGRRHHMEAVIQYGLARTVKVHHLIAAHEARAALGGENV